MLHVKNS